MSDQCRNCVVRGNLDKCKETPCGHHDNWYALEQQKRINELEAGINKVWDLLPNKYK